MNSQHTRSVFRELREAHKLPGPCFSYLLPGRARSSALQMPWTPLLAGSLEVWATPKINIFCLFVLWSPRSLRKEGLPCPCSDCNRSSKGSGWEKQPKKKPWKLPSLTSVTTFILLCSQALHRETWNDKERQGNTKQDNTKNYSQQFTLTGL